MILLSSILFTAFFVINITITLILIDEIRDNTVDYIKVDYVEAINYVYIGLLGIVLIIVCIGSPYVISYGRKTDTIFGTGLKPAIVKPTVIN